ncbi:CHAP domain-containing protein [Lamprobacter modestohalophilus]|uniref:Amidase n=1 Tax=Lamprobacter modestohalophilus TaxID=1064514 RepID=A0A9X1B4C3_9GAMM|nr:CHAP domain-containing protein [Lamprobacter modestohalophilus]MBK1618452.1 amidase [Lamprobacter modestohalophilus]MEA1051882.1 CHAP domain-containing protein [Lamprobacter modestohalophilus]
MILTARLKSLSFVLLGLLALLAGFWWSASNPQQDGGATLPLTDGVGLIGPPRNFSPTEAAALFADSRKACEGPCITPFGEILGIADGAEARSNCTSRCVLPKRGFLDLESGAYAVLEEAPEDTALVYVGITYQCVGYARYWWMKNLSLTFGDVDDAHQILYLTEATDPRTGETFALGRSVNGSAERPPQRGDLLVYAADRDDPEWRFGHVAVIVGVDLERSLVSVAEENYDNHPWQNPEVFARQVRLFEINGRYTMLDLSEGETRNSDGGQIAGWIYPVR